MKVEMELHPNFVSDIVVKQLQEMYEHTKEDYFYTDPEEAQAAIALVLDYFMPSSAYYQWRADNGFDRNLAEEVVEGFDHLEKKREWVGLTGYEIRERIRGTIDEVTVSQMVYCVAVAKSIEAKLKEKNT